MSQAAAIPHRLELLLSAVKRDDVEAQLAGFYPPLRLAVFAELGSKRLIHLEADLDHDHAAAYFGAVLERLLVALDDLNEVSVVLFENHLRAVGQGATVTVQNQTTPAFHLLARWLDDDTTASRWATAAAEAFFKAPLPAWVAAVKDFGGVEELGGELALERFLGGRALLVEVHMAEGRTNFKLDWAALAAGVDLGFDQGLNMDNLEDGECDYALAEKVVQLALFDELVFTEPVRRGLMA